MMYAVIADVHGNYPALQAVLMDARAAGATHFLLAGDYITDMPYTREIVDTLHGLQNSVIVSGNREWYMDSLNPSQRDQEQFAGLFLTQEALGEELEWVKNLPRWAKIQTEDGAKTIFLEHVCDELYCVQENGQRKLASGALDELFRQRDATHEEVASWAKECFLENPQLPALVQRTGADVVIHGHSHLQYTLECDNVLYLNPGSCGLPLDHQPGAPYTLLCYENGEFSVEERRVRYDVEKTIKECRATEFYRKSRGWCELNFWQLRTARDHNRVLGRFLQEERENSHPVTDQEFNWAFYRALERTRKFYEK